MADPHRMGPFDLLGAPPSPYSDRFIALQAEAHKRQLRATKDAEALVGASMVAGGMPVDGLQGNTPLERAVHLLRGQGYADTDWPLCEVLKW